MSQKEFISLSLSLPILTSMTVTWCLERLQHVTIQEKTALFESFLDSKDELKNYPQQFEYTGKDQEKMDQAQ